MSSLSLKYLALNRLFPKGPPPPLQSSSFSSSNLPGVPGLTDQNKLEIWNYLGQLNPEQDRGEDEVDEEEIPGGESIYDEDSLYLNHYYENYEYDSFCVPNDYRIHDITAAAVETMEDDDDDDESSNNNMSPIVGIINPNESNGRRRRRRKKELKKSEKIVDLKKGEVSGCFWINKKKKIPNKLRDLKAVNLTSHQYPIFISENRESSGAKDEAEQKDLDFESLKTKYTIKYYIKDQIKKMSLKKDKNNNNKDDDDDDRQIFYPKNFPRNENFERKYTLKYQVKYSF